MPIRKLTTNFTAGEVSPEIKARSDLPVYANGLELCRNLRPLASGGVRRRGGLAHVAILPDTAYQHNEWIFNAGQTYQLIFAAGIVYIHDGDSGALLQALVTPITADMIFYLSVHCSGDFAFICHPNLPITQIRRTSAVTFVVEPFVFDRTNSGAEAPVWQPYHRFTRGDTIIRVHAISGYSHPTGWSPGATATITTVEGVFTPQHLGTFLLISDAQWEITTYYDAFSVIGTLRSADFKLKLIENALTINAGTTLVKVYDPFHNFVVGDGAVLANVVAFGMGSYDELNGGKVINAVDESNWYYLYAPTGPVLSAPVIGGGANMVYWSGTIQTADWKEQMYSAAHGWPHCVSSFQSRLIFGGGRDTPNRLSFSRLEAPFNFDVGTGEDDDAILIGISGRKPPTVRAVVGSQHLQIFTSEGEYYVPRGQDTMALTPSDIAVLPQTFYGTKFGVPCVEFDGATLFISENGHHLRQLAYGAEGSYSAADLSFLAHHLIGNPVWMAVQMEDPDQAAATAMVLNQSGDIAALTMMRSEKVAAWSLWSTNGYVRTCCAVNNRAFFVIQRNINGTLRSCLEKLDRSRLLDGSVMGTYLGKFGQNYGWGGFTIYGGVPITIVVDGLADIGTYVPDGAGNIFIPSRASTVEGGFGFSVQVRTLPPELGLPDGPTPGEPRRVISANLQVLNTVSMDVTTTGIAKPPTKVRNAHGHEDLGLATRPVSGWVIVWLLGWNDKGQIDITQSSNGPFTLLAANYQVEF